MGVTGDQVPISGTRVRHVPLKSNVHSTPRVKETEVQPLSELASSTATVIRFFNDLERKLILSMFAEFLVLKKSARTFKGLFVEFHQCFASNALCGHHEVTGLSHPRRSAEGMCERVHFIERLCL